MLYYAFMLKVINAKSWSTSSGDEANDWRDIFLVAEGGSDVLGNSLRARFFLKQDPDDATKVHYSISKNTAFSSTIPTTGEGELVTGQTYLVVIRQTFTGNKLEVIVNPSLTAEPTTGWIDGKTDDTNTFGGTYGIGLRRRNLSNNTDIRIGGIRVAKTYADVIGYSSTFNTDLKANINNIRVSEKNIVTDCAGSLSVFSLTGTEILSQATNGSLATDLANGMYIVRFVNEQGVKSAAKIVVK